MPDSSKQPRGDSVIGSRRRFLRAAGIAGTVGLAGCSGGSDGNGGNGNGGNGNGGNGNGGNGNGGNGNGNGDGDGGNGNGNGDGDGGDGGEPVVFEAINEDSGIPNEQRWNPYGQNYASIADRISFEKLGTFDLRKYQDEGVPEWIPMAASEWDIPEDLTEGTTISVTAADDRTWHNGDEITAEDLYTHFRLMYHFGSQLYNQVDPDSLEVADDKTVEMEIAQETNPRILKMDLIGYQYGGRLSTKADIYSDHLEAIEEAEGEEATDEAMQELSEFEVEEPVGTGWGKFVEATQELMVFETYDDHPVGSELPFDRFSDRHTGDPQQSYQRALAEEIDYLGDSASETVANQLVDRQYDMFQHTYLSSSALQFNYDRAPFDDPHVRKAMAYAIDLEKATRPIAIEGPWGALREPAPSPFTGLMVGEENYLGDLIDGFESYSPYEADAESAAEMMEQGGYNRNGNGQWEMDGETITVPITVYSDWNQKSTYITPVEDDLINAGFDAEINAIPGSEAQAATSSGDYDIVQGFWGQSWHPITMYDIFHPDEGWMTNNHPETVEVPMPVGEPDGDLEEVNVWELMEDLRRASTVDDEREIVQILAWVFNQMVPQIPVFLGFSGVWLNTNDWTIEDWEGYERKIWDGEWELFNLGLIESQ